MFFSFQDSGHAFIYEKNSGSVVSMLKADKSTCNGVVPHPTLPFFLTYGIDSTAKLWRASNPVDDDDDDSGIVSQRQFCLCCKKIPKIHTNAIIELFLGTTKGLSRRRIYKKHARIKMF